MSVTVLTGDALDTLRTLPAETFRCCVTSPPYYGLRDYGVAGQIGLEPTPDEYVARLVRVFREVRRVLADDGTLWLNMGDSYARDPRKGVKFSAGQATYLYNRQAVEGLVGNTVPDGCKPKDMLGIPWLLAFALRADGWFLRRDIIWHKPNPMPESVRDRPTSAHEYVFLLSKSARYFYDADAVREPPSAAMLKQVRDGYNGRDTKDFAEALAQSASGTKTRIIANARAKIDKQRGHGRRHAGFNDRWDAMSKEEQRALGSNRRSVWTIATEPCAVAHYAVMPNALAELCILAGSKSGDHVLDPFGGTGTTGLVAERLNRHSTLIDLDPRNKARFSGGDTPLFAEAAP